MSFKSKRKSKKVYNRNKTSKRRNKYSNKKRVTRKRRVTRKQKGGVDPPGTKRKSEVETAAEIEEKTLRQYTQATAITRQKINKLRAFGYIIDYDTNSNKWIISDFPEIQLVNRKLPYILRSLSPKERSELFDLLINNSDESVANADHLVEVFNQIIQKGFSGCDLERDPLVEQALINGIINAGQIAPYRGKIGTIVSPDGLHVDTSDGMKSVANVRVIVPEELPLANQQTLTTPLSPGLYKYLVKQDNTIMIAPSNYVNFSMIKYYGLKYLVPGTPNGGNQNLFFVNIDKILPKVRLLASFGQSNIYNNWFQFLQRLAQPGSSIIQSDAATFQTSIVEIHQWIQEQGINPADYVEYPGWDNTCFTISEISHPCLNQGIKDIQVAGEFCVICDERGNCYIVQVTTYSGHYHPPNILLPMVKNIFHGKRYTNLEYFPQHQCLAKSEPDAILQQHECQPYDLGQLQHENAQGAVQFMQRTHSVRRATGQQKAAATAATATATATAMQEEE
jgi:hypothetical protein